MKLKLDDKGAVVVQDGKPVYVHDDGKEVAFDAVGTVATIGRLNGEAKSHRERAEAAEAKLKAFDGITDAEAARKALETMKNIDEGKLMAAGKVDEIKAAAKRAAEEQVAAANKANADALAASKAREETLQGQLHMHIIGGAFARSKYVTEKLLIPADMAEARFGNAFKIEDGKVVAYDKAGNKLYSKARPGELADFDEALESLVDQYPYKADILRGPASSGGGAGGDRGAQPGAKQMKRAQFDALPQNQRAAHFANGGTLVD